MRRSDRAKLMPISAGVALGLVLAILTSAPARAQETTGSVAGTVTDTKGEPIPFVAAVIAGDRGQRQVLADEHGRFLLAFLPPGTYKLTLSADGFSPLTDDAVKVGLGQRTTRRYTLVGTMQETVTVLGSTPAIETQTTSTGSNITSEQAEAIPLPRNVSSVVFLAPNVKSGGGTGNSNPSVGGSSGFENQYVFNGLNVTNAGYGALGAFSNVYGSQGFGINFNFVKETQILTNGFAPEFGQATGGVVNIITKSGTNDFHGSVYGNFTPTGLQAKFITSPLIRTPLAPILGIQKSDYGFDVGGPLKRDKLFFWLGANPTTIEETRRAPQGFPLFARGAFRKTESFLNYAGKLSLNITENHRLDFSLFGDPHETNMTFNTGSVALRQADEVMFSKLESGYRNWILDYHGIVNSKLLVDASVGSSRNTFKEKLHPLGNQWQYLDLTRVQGGLGDDTPITGGLGYTEPNSVSENDQAHLKFTKIVGQHELKVGLGFEDITYDFETDYSGPSITTRNGDTTTTGVTVQRRLDCSLLGNANVTETVHVTDQDALDALCGAGSPATDVPVVYRVTRGQISNPVRHTESKYKFAFLQDTWSTTPNVHVNFGVRWEKQSLQGVNLEYGFPHTWSPRIGVSWDPTHQGKSKLYGYWGRFYEKVPSDLAVRSLSEEIDILRGVYYDRGLGNPVPQGVGVGTRFIQGGTGTTEIVPGTKNSFTDGTLAGYQRELAHHWILKGEWHHREIGDILEDFSNVPASDVALGTNMFGHYIIGNIPPNVPVDTSGGGIAHYSYPKPVRDYQALVVEASRAGQRWNLTAQYSLSNLHGNYEGLYRNDNNQSDPNITSLFDFPNEDIFLFTFQNGDLNTNRTHRLQTYGGYTWKNGWILSSRFSLQSGIPKARLASHPAYENGGEILLARRGSLGETPVEYTADLKFGKKWKLPTNFESSFRFDVDIFNILNHRYPTTFIFNGDVGVELDVCTVDPADPACATQQQQYARLLASIPNGVPNVDYGKPREINLNPAYSDPREIRFGVKWEF